MLMTIDLNNPADIRIALEILPKYLPPDQASDSSSDSPIEERFVSDLWPRLGRTTRTLVKRVQERPGMMTIEALANDLGRPARSVRSTLNGPLARAIKSAKHAVPGAPDLFVWRHNGAVYELGLTSEMRAALAANSIDSDFDQIPKAE
jgi:hypothetical protein